ncbi:DNA topoisomerase 2-alpha-like [Lampetra planeri]
MAMSVLHGPPLKKNLLNVKDDAKSNRLSVERIYQKKTQLEHILLRPDTYIGSVEPVTQNMWVFDEEIGINCRDVTFVPGLFKIFDEILVNAADNKQRDPNMTCIKVIIDPENNKISVWNNGKGIPVVEHKVEKMYVPALIFGQLLTSSNYDDDEKKVTGGRNGYGAKLCNIFSTQFTVETSCSESKKRFKQKWMNNMSKECDSVIKPSSGEDFTCITFQPDLTKFNMTILDKDIIAIMTRRAYDIAGICKGVKVFLNGQKLPLTGFRKYVDLYLKDRVDESGMPLQVVHEVVSNRWEVCLCISEKGFQQVSFVNSIATTKGGRHVDYVVDQVTSKLIETVKKKNKAGIAVKPFQVKNHMWIFVNCLVENPTFDSQTKENMTLQHKKFGSTCSLSEKFIKSAMGCGIVESILNWVKFKAQSQLNQNCSSKKMSKLRGIPKLDDANDAGGKNSQRCTLILTEGDSAKTLAVSGLGVVGRDHYGIFPLRGKMLNVREASYKQIMENAEINNLIKIVGLQYKKKYDDPESLKTLRYGKIMIMTDQDQDGSHIKGLVINFIHHNWPSLLQHRFLEEFITPIVKVSKNKQELPFYSLPEFDEWKNETSNYKTWKIKYYKGLGTSTSKEAKEYFADMKRHRIEFRYTGPEDDNAITLAFSRKKIEDRKEWLTNWMVDRRQRREQGLPESFLYGKQTAHLTYNDFINKELILFSNSDNERSIPSLVDGFKPGQRKVLFTCFKRNDKREVKVAQLAGSVAEMSAYHHGEQSLMMTIVSLAQNFVGSNNINVLQPIGQFGTRLNGGKDAASPRYIFTMISTVARLLFPPVDDNLLKFLWDDNQRVEPEWYCPIIPLVLVNGSDGIGTGWASRIPNHNPREIINNIRRLLDGEEPLPMLPWYKNFKGSIDELGPNQFMLSGEISILDSETIEISELPVRTWTQTYKESVLEPMLSGTDKTTPLITDYKEYHTDTTVRFIIKISREKLLEAEAAGLHKVFKLQAPLTCNSMVLFDHLGCLKKYESISDILREFYEVRLKYYSLRKEWLNGILGAESAKLSNQARFILEKIEGTVVIENKPKKELIRLLEARGYDSDPIRAWKEAQMKSNLEEEPNSQEDNDGGEESSAPSSGPDYNYILNMALWCLTKERKDELLRQRDLKIQELENVKSKSPCDLWKDDLAVFVEELDRVEAQQHKDDVADIMVRGKGGPKKAGAKSLTLKAEVVPSPHGRRIVPVITAAMKVARKKIKTDRDGPAEIMYDEDGNELPSISPDEGSNLTKRVTKKPKETDGKKQTTLSFKPTVKKETKKNPWSESDSELDLSNLSSEDIKVPSRDARSKRAAAAQKFTYDSTDEEVGQTVNPQKPTSCHGMDNSSDSEDAFLSIKRALPAPSRQKKVTEKSKDCKPNDTNSKPATKKDIESIDMLLDSEDEDLIKITKAAVKAKPASKATTSKGSKTTAKKGDAKQPTILAVMSKAKAKPKESGFSSLEGDLAKTSKAAVAGGAKKRKVIDDSDSSPERVKQRSTAQQKKVGVDESFTLDDDVLLDNSSPVQRGPRAARAKKAVKYNFSDDESDPQSDF